MITVKNVPIGGNALVVIAGPCAIENRDTYFRIAKKVKAAGANMLRGGAFKPRTSPHDLDLEVPLGQEPFEPDVLLLQLAQTFDVVGVHDARPSPSNAPPPYPAEIRGVAPSSAPPDRRRHAAMTPANTVLPLRVRPVDQVLAEPDGTWRVLGDRPWLELVPPGGDIPEGWVLLRAKLERRGGGYAAYLHVVYRVNDRCLLHSAI